jgi:acyl-CoA hydrolase
MKEVKMEATRVEMTQLVLPGQANNHGTLFGGQLVAWMDTAASVAACRFCRSDVVTVSIDELYFALPIKRGDIVVLYAQVNQAWGSSMEIGVRAEAEDPRTGERRRACTGFLTFVRVREGQPAPLPKLIVAEGQEKRAQDAQERREVRLNRRKSKRG